MGGFKEINDFVFRFSWFITSHLFEIVWPKNGFYYWICTEEINSSLRKNQTQREFSNRYVVQIIHQTTVWIWIYLPISNLHKELQIVLTYFEKKCGTIFPLTLRFKVSVACMILSLPSLHIDFHFLLTLNPCFSMLKSRTKS